jgi:hypothetical protein
VWRSLQIPGPRDGLLTFGYNRPLQPACANDQKIHVAILQDQAAVLARDPPPDRALASLARTTR